MTGGAREPLVPTDETYVHASAEDLKQGTKTLARIYKIA
jgi:hypothetical protein